MRPSALERGQLWQYRMTPGEVRIYVVVDGPRVFTPDHNQPQALLLDLERGTQRLVTASFLTWRWQSSWSPFEP